MALSPLLQQVKSYVCAHFELGEDAVDGMLPVFFSTLQNHMETLEKAANEDNLESTARAGHTLKGALLNLGLDEMAVVARTIEEEGKAGNNEADYGQMVELLKEQLKEIL